jgi:hypothetical protein
MRIIRKFLEQFASGIVRSKRFEVLMRQLKHIDAGRHFGREEMNER